MIYISNWLFVIEVQFQVAKFGSDTVRRFETMTCHILTQKRPLFQDPKPEQKFTR